MYNFFGFQILTKEERKQKEEAFARMIFPRGEAQKRETEEALHAAFPSADREMLLFLYISIREKMCRNGMSFSEAWQHSMKKLRFMEKSVDRERFLQLMNEKNPPEED